MITSFAARLLTMIGSAWMSVIGTWSYSTSVLLLGAESNVTKAPIADVGAGVGATVGADVGAAVGTPVGENVGAAVGVNVDTVYETGTLSSPVSLLEMHEIETSPAAGFGARFVLNVNVVVPVLIVAVPVVIVIVFPVVPEAVAEAPAFAGFTTSVEAVFDAKTCLLYVQVIVSPAASSVVMPRARTRDSGVAPAARGLGTVVPRVSVV